MIAISIEMDVVCVDPNSGSNSHGNVCYRACCLKMSDGTR